MKKNFNIFMIIFFLIAGKTDAQNIEVDGQWVLTLNVSDFTAATWDQPTITSQSTENEILVNIYTYTGGLSWLWELLSNYGWIVSIRLSDVSNWPSTFNLYARRTGDGSSPYGGSISGGDSWIEVPRSSSQQFFTGSKLKNDIPIQYELRNISVDVAPGVYTTTVLYTITSS